jgi:opacity protein-like surface antigen
MARVYRWQFRTRHFHIWLAGLGIALLALLVAPAASFAEDHRSHFGKGKQYIGLSTGVGIGFSMGFMGDGDGKDVEFFDLRPRYGVGLTDVLGEGHWYRGNLDIMLEGEFLFEFSGGTFLAFTPVFRYNFLSYERVVPFVELGSGFGDLDFDLDDQADGFNFSPQFGGGFHYFVGDQFSFDSAVRWHHLSNASINSPNNSINDWNFSVGFTYYLD